MRFGSPRTTSLLELTVDAGPALHQAGIDPEQIQDAANCGVHHIVDGAWSAVEGGHRRENDHAQLRRFVKQLAVAGMQRRFARHEQQAAPLFERNVGGAHEQIIGERMSDRG